MSAGGCCCYMHRQKPRLSHYTQHAPGVPAGTKVALINLSWDSGNTAYVGRGAVPILLQVMNVNSSSPKSVGLLGYMPVIHEGSFGYIFDRLSKIMNLNQYLKTNTMLKDTYTTLSVL